MRRSDVSGDLFDVSGRTVIVTGGAGLLGREYGRALVVAGAQVVLADIDGPAVEAVADGLRGRAGSVIGVAVDVADESSVVRLVRTTLAHYGRIDGLVNNAAVDPKFDRGRKSQHTAAFEHYPIDCWNSALAVNLTGMFLCSREATREMVRRGIRVDVSRADNFDRLAQSPLTAEHLRLEETAERTAHWRRWGPYLADRQWGTVREDYSANGKAWDYFPHDHFRSRAYRWGEDGILGISDNHQRLCFAPSQPSEPWSAGRSSDRLGTARTRPGALRIARSAGPMTRRPKGNPA